MPTTPQPREPRSGRFAASARPRAAATLGGRGAGQAGAGWATAAAMEAGLLARHPGLGLDLYADSCGRVVLSRIVVPEAERGSGVGTKVMASIVEAADRRGWALACTPSPAFGGSKARLAGFYRRFGFVPNSGRNKDWTTRETMIRPARPPGLP